jgi:hypothetical protein
MPNAIASHLLFSLIQWKNPKELEENQEGCLRLPKTCKQDGNWHFKQVSKKIVMELALPLVISIALVESVVYGLFSLLMVCLYPIHDQPFQYAVDILSSSGITAGFAFVSILLNPLCYALPPKEWVLRYSILNLGMRKTDEQEMMLIWKRAIDQPNKWACPCCKRKTNSNLYQRYKVFIDFVKASDPQENFEQKPEWRRTLRLSFVFKWAVGEEAQKKNRIPPLFIEPMREKIEELRKKTFALETLNAFDSVEKIEQSQSQSVWTNDRSKELWGQLNEIVTLWERSWTLDNEQEIFAYEQTIE